jgi:hypothetical protein
MIADIRVGKLNRNLNVSKEARLIFEKTNIPRPTLAIKIDKLFRKLGF